MQYRATSAINVPFQAQPTLMGSYARPATHAYDADDQNESRADLAETALIVSTDRAGETDVNDVYTDVSDLLANIAHFCDRAGIDFRHAVDHARRAYEGDAEDGPVTQRDSERFPARQRRWFES